MNTLGCLLQVAKDSWGMNKRRYHGDFLQVFSILVILSLTSDRERLVGTDTPLMLKLLFVEALLYICVTFALVSFSALLHSFLLVRAHAHNDGTVFKDYVSSTTYREYTRPRLRREDPPVRLFGDRDDPHLPLSNFRRIDQLCREVKEGDLLYNLSPAPAIFRMGTIIVCAATLAAFGLQFIDFPETLKFVFLTIAILVACFSAAMIYGMWISKFILTNSLIHSRNSFLAKEVAVSDIIGAKISDKHLILNVRDGAAQRYVRFHLELYDPKECEQMLSVLDSLLAKSKPEYVEK